MKDDAGVQNFRCGVVHGMDYDHEGDGRWEGDGDI